MIRRRKPCCEGQEIQPTHSAFADEGTGGVDNGVQEDLVPSHQGSDVEEEDGGASSGRQVMQRRLGCFPLTLLGVGSTLGAGVYVVTGVVARNQTGPACVISFVIAGIVSIMSALSYAEFGARIPEAGSAYVYAYATIGEFMGFMAGWHMVLEYLVGTASVARAWSGYLNSLVGGAVANVNHELFGNSFSAFSPDLIALAITLTLTILIGLGVRESTTLNAVLTCVNITVLFFVVICGAMYANVDNWDPFIPPAEGNRYGVQGIILGAATLFYSYIGFDVIATVAEEVKNPGRNIPVSIVTSLMIIMSLYVATSIVLTLMVPYTELDVNAPLASAFDNVGLNWAKILISIGALSGLTTSLLAAIIPLPRIVFSMVS